MFNELALDRYMQISLFIVSEKNYKFIKCCFYERLRLKWLYIYLSVYVCVWLNWIHGRKKSNELKQYVFVIYASECDKKSVVLIRFWNIHFIIRCCFSDKYSRQSFAINLIRSNQNFLTNVHLIENLNSSVIFFRNIFCALFFYCSQTTQSTATLQSTNSIMYTCFTTRCISGLVSVIRCQKTT